MSATTRNQVFTAVHTVGGLLPADMLVRIRRARRARTSRVRPRRLPVIGAAGRSATTAERAWEYLMAVWRELREQLPVSAEADLPADPTGRAVVSGWSAVRRARLRPAHRGRSRRVHAPTATRSGVPGQPPLAPRPVHLVAWNAPLDKRPAAGHRPAAVARAGVPEPAPKPTCGGSSPTAGNCGCCATPTPWPPPAYVEFDLEPSSTASCSATSCCSTGSCTSPASRPARAGAPRPAGWSSGVRRRSPRAPGRSTSSATASSRRSPPSARVPRHPANAACGRTCDADRLHAAAAAPRLPADLPVRRRGPRRPPPPRREEDARKRYAKYFSSARLRRLALRRRGTAHADLYAALRIVLDALGTVRTAGPSWACPASAASSTTSAPTPRCADCALRTAPCWTRSATSRRCATRRPRAGGRWTTATSAPRSSAPSTSRCWSWSPSTAPPSAPSSWSTGRQRAQEDRLLLHPGLADRDPARLRPRPGDRRCPEARRAGRHGGGRAGPVGGDRPRLLSLTVCDPACGSGHFLVAAARRIAKRLAAVRESNPEPTPDAVRTRPARGRRPLHLRRRPQPDGGRAGQGLPVAGGPGAGQAAGLPGRPHQARQRPDRRRPPR